MTEVDFYSLSRSVQDNLIDSMSGVVPAPLLVRRGPRRTGVAWLGVAAFAALALAALAGAGYGDPTSALSLPPRWLVAVYALLAATTSASLFQALLFRVRAADLPFAPGVFLFPANVVDARASTLRVFPLEELTALAAGSGAVVASFGGATFAFPVEGGADGVRQAIERVEAAREYLRTMGDATTRMLVDPLEPPSVVSPLASDVARSRTPAFWERYAWPLGALVGAAIGAGVFFVRDVGSDAKSFAWAKARNDVPSYEQYLARGRRHRDVVSSELLPRAALHVAIRAGTVEAVDAITKAFPESHIAPEIAAAREVALAAELERDEKVGTFASVLGFAEKYPERQKNPAFEQARHALYARALTRYLKATPDAAADFVKRLVASVERTPPRKTEGGYRGVVVEVRLRRAPSKDLERADDLVRKSPSFTGPASLASNHLDAPHLAPHEKKLGEALAAALAGAFDPEIMTFEPRPSLPDGDGKLPEPTVPTLYVSYRVESSGTAIATTNPRGIFLGITFFFTADFVLPGDAHPLHTKLTLTERVPSATLRAAKATAPGVLEDQIYEGMTREAFEGFREKYLAMLLKSAK